MDMQSITLEMIISAYGDRADDFYIWKGRKRIGYISDLRRQYSMKQKTKAVAKEYRDRKSEEMNEALPEYREEFKDWISDQLVKEDCMIFINQTQPNIHINGCKCYIILNPMTNIHRLGIMHQSKSYDEMALEIDNRFKLQSCSSERHILINGVTQDDILELIKQLCK